MIVAFDVAGWFLLPERQARSFRDYRVPPELVVPLGERTPRNYYVPHDVMGFDIGPDRRSRHTLTDASYPVWSNSLGCFDREHNRFSDYVYFAGDSFTWGFAPYEAKFGTLIEETTGTQVLKCGVGHTGQLQQLAKLEGIVSRTKSMPKAVFVFFFSNDVANDYAYPHSTVIGGYLVEAVRWKSRDELERIPLPELARKAAEEERLISQDTISAERRPTSPAQRVKTMARRFSLTANIVNSVSERIAREEPAAPPAARRTDIYRVLASPRSFSYRSSPFAKANQAAWLSFKAWSDRNGVRLIAVLIPRFGSPDAGWYAELHEYLDSSGIEYLDLDESFKARGLDPATLYWARDQHFNLLGNSQVASIVVERFPDVFSRRRP